MEAQIYVTSGLLLTTGDYVCAHTTTADMCSVKYRNTSTHFLAGRIVCKRRLICYAGFEPPSNL